MKKGKKTLFLRRYFQIMIIIDDVIVTDAFLEARFCCDLPRCMGACCVEGDAGAPLSEEEIGLIEENIDAIKPYMREEGIREIEENDVFDYDDQGELVTSIIDGRECAFVYFHDNGTALCAIEKAFICGKTNFRKPLSCHLYPVRLRREGGFTYVDYHKWSVCRAAVKKGEKDGIPLWKYLKEPLIRCFGAEWYERLHNQMSMSTKPFNKA